MQQRAMHMRCLTALMAIRTRESRIAVRASTVGVRAMRSLSRIPFDYLCHQTGGGYCAYRLEIHAHQETPLPHLRRSRERPDGRASACERTSSGAHSAATNRATPRKCISECAICIGTKGDFASGCGQVPRIGALAATGIAAKNDMNDNPCASYEICKRCLMRRNVVA